MYNEYYKSWIPDVNVEKLKQNGFYKNILKDISDEDIIYAWDSQVYTLGVQTYNKTGYLEYCSCEGCLVHSQYNYNLLTLATVLKLFLIQRGGDGSLSLTGQITFAEAAVLKTGMSKDWDGGYNSSQYGSPYYNLSTLTKELMVIVQKNVTRTRFSNIKSNQMSIQCKRPTGTIFGSDTLRVSQTDQKISFNLWLSQNEMLTSEYLNIKYTVQGNPYLDFNAQSLLIFGSNTISIEPNQEDNLEARVKISEEQGNLLEAKEDGLYSSGGIVDFPITIEQGGTGQTNRENALLALLPDITGQNGKVLGVVNGVIAWVDKGGEAKNIVFGNGLQESQPDPETQIVTVSTKVNPSEFRYNDNGVIELSDQVTNALAKADSSVQTVNNTPPDENGNVNVAGSLPVLTLISDFVGEISVLKDWLLAQPDQRSTLYIKTETLPDIQIIVTANGFTESWETLAHYIKSQVRSLYDGCPNFTCIYNTDGELELSTNDILNPIQMYIPIVPDNESLNVQMKLVPPGAVIVSQPYATIDQVNTIVNNAVIPLQQDIRLLNLDMFFADYYIGISINYLLSGKWDGDKVQTYNEILADLNDTNTLKFTLTDGLAQYNCPLTITKEQFINFVNLDTFNSYISDQMESEYNINNFLISFTNNQGFIISNLDSNTGVLVCEQDNNNLAVIMRLTDLTGAKDRIYTEFSQESLQQQIIDNKLIIDDVFINKINNGENVTIDVDSETNTATFSATGGGSSGANKVTVTINGQNPESYNVDGAGNITIDVPLTSSLKSNLLNITTVQSGANKGETELIVETTNQLSINTITKQIGLSSQTATDVAKGASALQLINPGENVQVSDKINNQQTISATGGSGGKIPTYNFTGQYQISHDPKIIPTANIVHVKKSFPSQEIVISIPQIVDGVIPGLYKQYLIKVSLAQKTVIDSNRILINGSGLTEAYVQDLLNTSSQSMRTLIISFENSANVSFVCTINDCPNMKQFALFIESKVKVSVPTFTCGWSGTNFFLSSNDINNKIKYSEHVTGYGFAERLLLENGTGASYSESINIALTSFFEQHEDYEIANPPSIMTIDNEYFTLHFDPRGLFDNPLVYNKDQALMVITSTAYTNGTPLNNLPIANLANFTRIPDTTQLSYWALSNQIYYSPFLYVPQLMFEYTNTDINQTTSGDLLEYYPVFTVNQSNQSSWETLVTFKGEMEPAKEHYLRIKFSAKTISGLTCDYTINGQKEYQWADITIPAIANPITTFVVQCANNNIVISGLPTPVLSSDIGINGLDRGQINLGDGYSNQWIGTQLFHAIPLSGKNWKFDLLTGYYIINGGGKVSLDISGTFTLSELFVNPTTKLYICLININDYREVFSKEILYTNQTTLKQKIELTLEMDLTEQTETKEYKLLVFSTPDDANVSFKIIDYLGLTLTYE